MLRFEIKKSNDKYYFIIYSQTDEVLATSEIYDSKIECWHGAKAIKKYSQTAPIFDHPK
jgi:uncharacterized protein YegP (UPF0339 family)